MLFLLGIIPKCIIKKNHSLLKYILTTSRINLAQQWKRNTLPTI